MNTAILRFGRTPIRPDNESKKQTNKCFLLLFFFFSILLLHGCGQRQDLSEYKSEMEQFYTSITAYDQIINHIDPTSETAVEELLSALTDLNTSFAHMASLPVPQEFSAIKPLAKEAGEYMAQAVELYHLAYESLPFDHATASAAKEYYDRANKRAIYILQILHGETPG